jgi:hypothetical protein
MIPQILASIGWPIVTLIFAVFFVLLFRKPLFGFIERIRSVSKDGVSTESIQKAQIEEPKKKAVEDLMRLGDSTLLKEIEAAIADGLEKQGLDSGSDSVKVLTHHLAATQIALEFEQVHSVIFGSQIFLLKKLNEYPGVGLDSDFVAQHFAHVHKLFPESLGNWTIEQYLSFLFNRFLIRQDFGKYHITIRGAEFLIWMIRMSRSENRPL